MNRPASRISNSVSRLAVLGGSAFFAYAFLEEYISPFIPLTITVFGSLIAGFIFRAIFIHLLNKRLFSEYRYTNTNNKRSDTAPNEKINRDNSFAPPDSLSLYRNLLGLGPRFTGEELKAAYRNCAAMYHPDRYASASRSERQNAEDIMKKVNEAYERLKSAAL